MSTQQKREDMANALTSASSQLREAMTDLELGLCAIIQGQSAASVRASARRAADLMDHAKRHLRRLQT